MRLLVEHQSADDEDLHEGDGPLLNAVDKDALDGVHVFQDASHNVARGAVIEPVQRQPLDVRIEIAAQVENDFLLEGVVQQNAQAVGEVLQEERAKPGEDERQKQRGLFSDDDFINDLLGDGWKNHDEQGGEHGAGNRSRSHPRITAHIGEDTPDRAQTRLFFLRIISSSVSHRTRNVRVSEGFRKLERQTFG